MSIPAPPASVRQIVLTGVGGPEVLREQETTVPAIGPHELLIATEAAGVAFNDITTRRGINPGRPPRVLGFDAVGRVVAAGASVTRFRVGDRVGALIGTGGYSSHVVAPERVVAPIPEDLDAAEADALMLNYVVAYRMLHDVAAVRAGQRVLVHAAGGGVGSALLQLARIAGVEAVGIASPSRRPVVEGLGASWVATIDEAGGGFDAVFDGVGGPSLAVSRRHAARTGIVVSFGLSFLVGAGRGRIGGLLRAGAAVLRARLVRHPRTALFLIESTVSKDPERIGEVVAELAPLVRERRLVPVVTRMPLARAAEAHRMIEARETQGKVVLIP